MSTENRLTRIPPRREKRKKRKRLIDKLLAGTITAEELALLMDPRFMSFKELQPVIKRIFNLNEGDIVNKSSASVGALGLMNRLSKRNRNRKFNKKISRGFRAHPKGVLIVAEGDSWFEYPYFIKEVIDQLSHRKDYAIHSMAYGADWLSNILYEGKYIKSLDTYKPDVFLISGGGNDTVGDYRLSELINPEPLLIANQEVQINSSKLDGTELEKYQLGKSHLNKNYEALLNVFRIQYTLMFKSIYHQNSPHRKVITITQGYDYPIPSNQLGFGFNPLLWHRPVTNKLFKNGRWLYLPLMLNGITDGKTQRAIAFTIIHDFNEMLIEVGKNFDYVFHIDCRHSVGDKEWFNELHPKSRAFKRIADAYQTCIDQAINSVDGGKTPKIFKPKPH